MVLGHAHAVASMLQSMHALMLIMMASDDQPKSQEVKANAPREAPVAGGPIAQAPGNLEDYVAVPWSEVKLKKRITPKLPEDAEALGLNGRCDVRLHVNEQGTPTLAEATEDCVLIFQEPSETALMKWRFYPHKVDGEAVPVTFVVEVEYAAVDAPQIADAPKDDEPAYRAVHWSEVMVKKQVPPKMPEEAKELGIEGRCVVRLFVDDTGRVDRTEIEVCDTVFHESTAHAVEQWQFYPFKLAGEPTPVTFLLAVEYQHR